MEGKVRIGLMILARCKQGRWPEKILVSIDRKPMIEQVVKRSRQINGIDEYILGTSINPEDKNLKFLADAYGMEYFQGDPEDVVLRIQRIIDRYKLTHFVSVPPGFPFFSIEDTNIMVKKIRQEPDYDGYHRYLRPKHIHVGLGHFVYGVSARIHSIRTKQPNRPLRMEGGDPPGTKYTYWAVAYEDRNKYLIATAVIYPFHAVIANRIIDYLGYYPQTYQDIERAYYEITKI